MGFQEEPVNAWFQAKFPEGSWSLTPQRIPGIEVTPPSRSPFEPSELGFPTPERASHWLRAVVWDVPSRTSCFPQSESSLPKRVAGDGLKAKAPTIQKACSRRWSKGPEGICVECGHCPPRKIRPRGDLSALLCDLTNGRLISREKGFGRGAGRGWMMTHKHPSFRKHETP